MLSHNTLTHLFYYPGNTLNFLQSGDSFEVFEGAVVKKYLQGSMNYTFTNWSPPVRVVIDFDGDQSLQFVFNAMNILADSGSLVAVAPSNRFTIYNGVVQANGTISRNIYVEGGDARLMGLMSLNPLAWYIRVNGGRAIMTGVPEDPAPLGLYRGNIFGWERQN